jgi:hypothetical protein
LSREAVNNYVDEISSTESVKYNIQGVPGLQIDFSFDLDFATTSRVPIINGENVFSVDDIKAVDTSASENIIYDRVGKR